MRKIKFTPLIAITFFYFYSMLTIVYAKSPLGIGVAEQPINNSPFFSEIYIFILSWQHFFEQTIRECLISLTKNPQDAIWLIGISFLYGIIHAAGVGHGKAIIASYLVANNASLKRGIFLSFLSSILQAFSAIFIILIVFTLLPAQLTQATSFLTTGSFILIMLLGIFMIWKKIKPLLKKHNINKTTDQIMYSSTLPPQTGFQTNTSNKSKWNNKPRLNYVKDGIDHLFKGTDEFCNECGQAHMISPEVVKEPLELRPALMAVLSVGLRPCTGAIFVMSFTMVNNLWLIGTLSVLSMSLGTFITVSLLASLAVYAKSLALKISKRQSHLKFFTTTLEWCAAIFIFITGLSLTLTAIIY